MSQKQWRILDLLKVQALPKPSRSPSSTNIQNSRSVARCVCCGAALLVADGTKFHCSVCHTTTLLEDFNVDAPLPVPVLSYAEVKRRVDECLGEKKEDRGQLMGSHQSLNQGRHHRQNPTRHGKKHGQNHNEEEGKKSEVKHFSGYRDEGSLSSSDGPRHKSESMPKSSKFYEANKASTVTSTNASVVSGTNGSSAGSSNPPSSLSTGLQSGRNAYLVSEICVGAAGTEGRGYEGESTRAVNTEGNSSKDAITGNTSHAGVPQTAYPTNANATAHSENGTGGHINSPNSGTSPSNSHADRHALHLRLKPLLDYIHAAFSSMSCLNQSFHLRSSRRAHYSLANIDFAQIRQVFHLLASLPSRRPLFCALSGACECLRRLPVSIADNPRNLYWVAVLFEIPFLSRALTNSDKRPTSQPHNAAEIPEIQALCYEILKRVLSLLSAAESSPAGNYFASWFSKLDTAEFSAKVDLVNLYITFHLRKHFYFANNPELARRALLGSIERPRKLGPCRLGSDRNISGGIRRNLANLAERRNPKGILPGANMAHLQLGSLAEVFLHPNTGNANTANGDRLANVADVMACLGGPAEYFDYSYLKDEVEEMQLHNSSWANLALAARRSSRPNAKIRVHQYCGNYHLRTAASALGVLVKANYIRRGDAHLPAHAFYNSMADYVNVRLDFDSWLSKRKAALVVESQTEPALQTLMEYIHSGADSMPLDAASSFQSFYFCQYPFLVTLGGKISILEYEARRLMERKAEEAFINLLDRRVALDVYFKVRIRREYIVQDLLRCIQLNPSNLKKSLKVQFVNEPGVDAGGLKKEWFLLLARALFSPLAGMLCNVEDSNYLWFNVIPVDNSEMYYLFGAVLGLAIYNSTILDLKFPAALYKLLLGLPVGLADYHDIFPVAATNLFKIRDFSAEDLEILELTFEVTFHDAFGRLHFRELIPGGKDCAVTIGNRERYIDKYARFFLTDGIQHQIRLFKAGFSSVVDGNSLSLFLPEEIQLLLCGSEETKFDVDMLKSITQYSGWGSKEDAIASPFIRWFWEHVEELTFSQQKKLLLFITGSDRVPATGMQNLTLKISRLNGGEDSDRLPVAHTCFNELSIYQYSSKEKMVDKLTKAVNMLAGFGIK